MKAGYIFTAIIDNKEVMAVVIDTIDVEKSIHHLKSSWLCYGGNTLFVVNEHLYSEDVIDNNGFVYDINVTDTKSIDRIITTDVTIPHTDDILNEAIEAKENFIRDLTDRGLTREEAVEAFNETAISNGEETIR